VRAARVPCGGPPVRSGPRRRRGLHEPDLTWAGGARYEARVNRLVLPLLLLAACNVSAGGEPPQPVKIASFEASPAQVAAGGDVALTWSISGPVQRLVIAAGGCACELDVSATSFTDS